ncbi:hypothetical protein J2P12_04225 [Candidatus Bathyarchaeota archaeon]|nr:hypothetical protein [Candidatus Bathyarchaeota archaeon]
MSEASDAERLGIKTIGQGEDLPETAETGGLSNSIMRNFDDTGLHTVGFYDENGNLQVRIDVRGPPHARVPTPHVVDYFTGPRPGGGYGFRKAFWGPTTPEMDQIIQWISEIFD